ncbi:MAG: hypothetical protein H6Q89_3580 [Myxococcaceae bacterium]|nr:hypothetical protein [Myxococcaceae bacterium]
MTSVLTWAGQALLLYLGATFCFDVVHWGLHAAHRSAVPVLRSLGGLHHTHHLFLDRRLKFDDALIGPNFWRHRTGELAIQLLGASAGYLFLAPVPVLIVQGIFTVSFGVGIFLRGKDSNHREQAILAAPLGGVFVGLAYHSLHHAFPDRYFGSVTTAFDRLFGTGCQVAGRKVAITGASGAFGGPLKKLLEAEGASVTALKHGVDFVGGDCAKAAAVLASADILILAHGSRRGDPMAANCDSFLALIERFRHSSRGRQVPAEVWAVGSEIECHPAFGNPELQEYSRSKRAFARHARRYFHQSELLYRHIVPSAFTSPMGPGLISGELAAAWAWFLIKRGWRYVPVSYTGIALVNYLKFALRLHALAA